MIPNGFLKGEQIYLRILEEFDVNDHYVKWLNDYEVTKFTESRFKPHTIESLKSEIGSMINNNNITFAIVEKEKNKHIGNIKLGNINWIHRYAEIGLIIGEKDYWGKGIAREAIGLVVDYAFKGINLRKLNAGIYINNVGSIKAFQKCGFKQAFIEKEKYFFEGKYIDSITLEIFNA